MRKQFSKILSPKVGVVSGLGLLLNVLADFPAAWENVMPAVPMSATIVYYVALFGAIYFGGLLVRWFIPPSVQWVKYRLNDGPNVDRFRGLEADIRACRSGLSSYYSTRRRPTGVSPLLNAPGPAASFADLEWLFAQLISLNIPLPDYTRYSDFNPKGEQFWEDYLETLESYAKRGYLRGARLRNLHKSIWAMATVEDSDGDSKLPQEEEKNIDEQFK